ncbi:hypothetical protein OAN44_01345 [Flavobacteriales bacterium]|nr:hypothetical protein [bacterium]MDB2539064.1 hypothetical protein [Flavobacteriales bacterium]MDC0520750.1 hypothetical protein [Flavobacteriales bacterium]
MKTLKFTLLSILILSIYSCGKYEEGPGFTLLSKSARMCQKWRPIQSVDGSTGVITNIDSDGSYIEFVKDGSIQYYNKDQMSFLGIDAVAGTWEFSDDKMQVSYSYDVLTLNTIKLETIKKLKINSLGLEDNNGNKIYYEYY